MILFPHGVLFRNGEWAIREKLIAHDVLECDLGLGPTCFKLTHGSLCGHLPHEQAEKTQENRVLFFNAANGVTREGAQNFLSDDHIQRILATYQAFQAEEGFTQVTTLDEIRNHDHKLSIPFMFAVGIAMIMMMATWPWPCGPPCGITGCPGRVGNRGITVLLFDTNIYIFLCQKYYG